jgi:dihydroorotate dehydrogenase
MSGNIYERFVRPLLFQLDPETAHHFAINLLRFTSAFAPALAVLRSFQPPAKPRTLFGLKFPNPIGLAAGFDKNGVAIPAWEALGFGFVEIGTVTARMQPGNPRPRIFRYREQRALINRLGFNNDGADAVAARLARLQARGRWPKIPVGINIGKSKAVPIEDAAGDYLESLRRLRAYADYIVINISSPNTPDLRLLQKSESLNDLLRMIQEENARTIPRRPLLVKIAPELGHEDLEEIVRACEAHDIAGLIATNTTVDHSAIPNARNQTGGLSGAPLLRRSTEILQFVCKNTRLPVVASGGIFDAQAAREKLAAGAALIQIYTGYIYRGPGLLHELMPAFG